MFEMMDHLTKFSLFAWFKTVPLGREIIIEIGSMESPRAPWYWIFGSMTNCVWGKDLSCCSIWTTVEKGNLKIFVTSSLFEDHVKDFLWCISFWYCQYGEERSVRSGRWKRWVFTLSFCWTFHYFTVIKFCEERNGKCVQCMVCPKQHNVYRTMELWHLPLHIKTAIHVHHVQCCLSGKFSRFSLNPYTDPLDEPLAAEGIQSEDSWISYNPPRCDSPCCDTSLLDANAFQINVAISGSSEECCMEDAPVPFSESWIPDIDNLEYELDKSCDLFDIMQSMKNGTDRLFPDISTPVNEEISDSSSEPGFRIELPGK